MKTLPDCLEMLMSADTNTVDAVDTEMLAQKLTKEFNLDKFKLRKLGDKFILSTKKDTIGSYAYRVPILNGKELSIDTIELNTNNDCEFIIPISNIELFYSGKNILRVEKPFYKISDLENVHIQSNGNLYIFYNTICHVNGLSRDILRLDNIDYLCESTFIADTIQIDDCRDFSKVEIKCNILYITERYEKTNEFFSFLTRNADNLISYTKLLTELEKQYKFELKQRPTKIIFFYPEIQYTFLLDKNNYKVIK